MPFRSRFETRDLAPLASLLVIGIFMAVATKGGLSSTRDRGQRAQARLCVDDGLARSDVCLAVCEIDLAVGMIALWTACFCGWTYQKHVVGLESAAWLTWLVLFGALATTSVVLGLISGTTHGVARLPSFIITLAMMYIADGAARFLTKSETFNVPDVLKTLGNGGLSLSARFTLPYSAIVAATVAAVGHIVLQHTRFGRR